MRQEPLQAPGQYCRKAESLQKLTEAEFRAAMELLLAQADELDSQASEIQQSRAAHAGASYR